MASLHIRRIGVFCWEIHVTDTRYTPDVWDSLAAFLWWLILLAGLFPETFFYVLRELGHVTTQQAFTNTPWFISLSCAGFVGWFTFQRSREAGDKDDIAFGKGVQVLILGFAAFLPLQIEQTPVYLYIPIPFYRNLLLGIVGVKVLTWIYLVQLILRYYLFSGIEVFRKMTLVFPSALLRDKMPNRDMSASTGEIRPPYGEEE